MITYEELCDSLVFDTDKIVNAGYYVSSKLFKQFYLERQNKIIRNGKVVFPIWEKIGNGVYKVSI